MNLTRYRAGVLALALAALPTVGWAQSVPSFQSGTVTPGDLIKSLTQGLHGDAGGLLGDPVTGKGVNPFAVTDRNGLAFCANTATTSSSYHSLCLGHDANGNPIFAVDNTTYAFSPSATGNLTGPNSSVVGDLFLANNTTGTLAKTSGFAKIDPNANDGAGGAINGHAVISWTPTLGTIAGLDHQDAMFIQPSPSSYANMGTVGDYLVAYNMKWMTGVNTPVPGGTKGNLAAFECNITTAQTVTDSTNDGHCFGGTYVLTGGAGVSGVALTAIINSVASAYKGVNIHIENNVAFDGTHAQTGYFASSDGSQNANAAFQIAAFPSNKFGSGFVFNGTNADSMGQASFAGTNSVATDYLIVGSSTATFQMVGGGSAGGIQTFGAPRNSGNFGAFKWTNNTVAGVVVGAFDYVAGDLWIDADVGATSGVGGNAGIKLLHDGTISTLAAASALTLKGGAGGSVVTSSILNVGAGLQAAGVTGVTCPAGVTAGTVTVANGIVTHC